jgi:hypothetical protein
MKPSSLILVSVFFASCANNADTETGKKQNLVAASTHQAAAKEGIEGLYSGAFDGSENWDGGEESIVNRITIAIDSLKETTLYGHSIVAGNLRPFKGSYKKDANTYTAKVEEPGDEKYDGVFQFTIDKGKAVLKGTWVANNKSLAMTRHEYELSKKEFKYDPSLVLPEGIDAILLYGSYNEESEKGERLTADVFLKNPSVDLLKSKDIENMYLADLEVLRNSIYARHGYSFKNRKMRSLFDENVDWYIPVSTNVTAELTEIEKKNIALIKRYEKHATKYYDSFGR